MKFKLTEKKKKNRKHQMGYFTSFLPDKEKGIDIFNNLVDYSKVDGNPDGGVTADGGNAVSENIDEEVLNEKSAYHYGDLNVAKKAERRHQMSGGRSTGHFGTGFYALSEPCEDTICYSNRDIWEVDLDKYNLFKPKTEREAYDLHDCLAMVNTSVDFNSYDEDEIINDMDTIFDKFVRGEENEEVKYELRNYLSEQGFNEDYIDYVMWAVDEERLGEADERIKRYIRDNDEALSEMIRAEDKLSQIFGKDVSEEFREAIFSKDQEDSKSTVFMKNLGYEGIDVTDLEQLDNFRYGSVIYDLKPNTYKKIEKEKNMDKKEALMQLEDYSEEETAKCVWCGDEFPVSDLHKEKDMGYLCDHCRRGIESRGEELEFEDEYLDVKQRIGESLNESSMLIDEFSISDKEKLKVYWDKNDGYVVEKIYNQGNDLWRTDFKKTFHDELSAKRYFSRAKKKFGVNESVEDEYDECLHEESKPNNSPIYKDPFSTSIWVKTGEVDHHGEKFGQYHDVINGKNTEMRHADFLKKFKYAGTWDEYFNKKK